MTLVSQAGPGYLTLTHLQEQPPLSRGKKIWQKLELHTRYSEWYGLTRQNSQ